MHSNWLKFPDMVLYQWSKIKNGCHQRIYLIKVTSLPNSFYADLCHISSKSMKCLPLTCHISSKPMLHIFLKITMYFQNPCNNFLMLYLFTIHVTSTFDISLHNPCDIYVWHISSKSMWHLRLTYLFKIHVTSTFDISLHNPCDVYVWHISSKSMWRLRLTYLFTIHVTSTFDISLQNPCYAYLWHIFEIYVAHTSDM